MSRSDHNRSRKHPYANIARRVRNRTDRYTARRVLRQGADDVPRMIPARSQCGHGCCW